MDPLAELAVVVPVGPGDEAWRGLVPDLLALPDEAQVVFVGTESEEQPMPRSGWSWIKAPAGRARQLNAGARATTHRLLWFLHADSRFAGDTLPRLADSLRHEPDALHFFHLRFLPDGPVLMRVNEIGVRLRSHWAGIPFGDQGFCMPRDVWECLGGFPVDARYGEDHLFVWRARQAGVRLRSTGGTLRTSARKYREGGWLATTVRHLRLTAAQAFPEWIKLLRTR